MALRDPRITGNRQLKSQSGAALLLLLVLAVVAGVAVFSATQDPEDVEEARKRHDRKVLQQAKQALIAYAAFANAPSPQELQGQSVPTGTDDNRPGELSCPDRNNDGQGGGDGNPGTFECYSYLGFLPFETLGLPDLRDSSGARLWYAVSHAYQTYNQREDQPLNSNVPGALTLDGQPMVAILIAPGEIANASQQDRPDAEGAFNAEEVVGYFLEGLNADGDPTLSDQDDGGSGELASTYFSEVNNPGGNDLVIGIASAELWQQAVGRPLEHARDLLTAYYGSNNRLPYATKEDGTCVNDHSGLLPVESADCNATDSLPKAEQWFVDNGWDEVIYYVTTDDCTASSPCQGAGGALTLDSTGVDALIVDAGAELPVTQCAGNATYDQTGRRTASSQVCDYLDIQENTDGDTQFTRSRVDQFSNDRFVTLDLP